MSLILTDDVFLRLFGFGHRTGSWGSRCRRRTGEGAACFNLNAMFDPNCNQFQAFTANVNRYRGNGACGNSSTLRDRLGRISIVEGPSARKEAARWLNREMLMHKNNPEIATWSSCMLARYSTSEVITHFPLCGSALNWDQLNLPVRTHRSSVPGFSNPRRSGLVAEARGNAPTLGRAIEVFANFTRGLTAVLSVAANAPVGHFTADIVFDEHPRKTRAGILPP